MRLLFAHNRYLLRGGEDESREQEMSMLRSRGHEVIEHVVDNRDVKHQSLVTLGIESVYNHRQFKVMSELIRRTKPDLLKVDNHFPILSPAIFEAAKSLNVPTVLSVRNYRLVCPSANLFRDGANCSECVGKKLAIPAIRHRCYRSSYLQTSSVVLSNAYAHMRGTWHKSIDQFVAVSEFVKAQLVLGGFDARKIAVKGNSIADTGAGDGSGKYALYVGRLTEEKGVRTLLEAWGKISNKLPLKVIGVGPLEGLVGEAASAYPGIESLGWKSIAEVCDYLGRAKVLIFPSVWPEPFGRSIVEAYSKGTPVIAANTMPMQDMVEDGETGWLFKAGSGDSLAETVLSIGDDPAQIAAMRQKARSRYLTMYSEEQNYQKMMEIFERVRAS